MRRRIALAVVLIPVALASGQWEPLETLTTSPNLQTACNNTYSIAAQEPDVHVVWWDRRDGDWEIYYKRSTDRGLTWQNDTRLTNAAGTSWHCAVAALGPVVHVAWSDNRDGTYEVYYTRSTDRGLNWDPAVVLSTDSVGSLRPSIAVAGSLAFLAWEDNRCGHAEVFYTRSTDEGLHWDPDQQLTSSGSGAASPTVAVIGAYVHVAWADVRTGDGEIFYKRSTDNGVTWSPDLNIVNNPDWNASNPAIAAAGSDVHVIWFDHRGDDYVYYRRSTNKGQTWEPEFRFGSGMSDYPSIAASEDNVHVVWWHVPLSHDEIYYRRSTNRGAGWENGVQLTDSSYAPAAPSIAVCESVVHAVWVDHYNLCYRRNPTGNPVAVAGPPRAQEPARQLRVEPNPFQGSVSIRLSPAAGRRASELRIRDVLGRLVRVLAIPQSTLPNSDCVDWDGADARGKQVAAGVYLCRLEADGSATAAQLVKLK